MHGDFLAASIVCLLHAEERKETDRNKGVAEIFLSTTAAVPVRHALNLCITIGGGRDCMPL